MASDRRRWCFVEKKKARGFIYSIHMDLLGKSLGTVLDLGRNREDEEK